MKKYIYNLKAGDIVQAHGGLFRVTEDAKEVAWHRPRAWGKSYEFELDGPSDCASAEAVCIAGEFEGYFKVGTPWVFKCNALAGQYTLVESTQAN